MTCLSLINPVEALLAFGLFMILQAVFINGVHACFQGGCIDTVNKGRVCSGMIFYSIAPKFFEKHRHRAWAKPFWTCIKCMSSVYGAVTFFGTVIPVFGFKLWEVPVFVADALSLVTINYFIYKKI